MEPFKRHIAFLILIAFFFLLVGGTVAMQHGLTGGCPFSAGTFSVCAQNSIAAALHHVSAYQSFLNAHTGASLLAILATLLIAATAYVVFMPRLSNVSPPAWSAVRYADASRQRSHSGQKLQHFTSLFENSPSRF